MFEVFVGICLGIVILFLIIAIVSPVETIETPNRIVYKGFTEQDLDEIDTYLRDHAESVQSMLWRLGDESTDRQ